MPEERVAQDKGKKGKKERKAGPPGRRKKFLLLLALLLVMGGAGAGTYFFLGHRLTVSDGADRPAAQKAGHEKLASKDLKDFTVNLANTEANRYLRVGIVIEYPEDKNLEKELAEKQNVIRDAIIALLRTKTVADIKDVRGSEKLKEELLAAINGQLQHGRVSRVYFVEFLIQ